MLLIVGELYMMTLAGQSHGAATSRAPVLLSKARQAFSRVTGYMTVISRSGHEVCRPRVRNPRGHDRR